MDLIEIAEYIKNKSDIEIVISNLQKYLNTSEDNYDILKEQYEKCEYNRITEPISYFEESIKDIKENWDKYIWLSQILEDDISKDVLEKMLCAKVTMDTNYIEEAYQPSMIYFSSEIWGELGNEVYIDCGAFDGDSILKFISICPWYKKIYAFEAIPEIMDQCKKELKAFEDDDIIYFQNAVSESRKMLLFDAESMSGESHMSESGNIRVEAIPLDALKDEKVTFIKMDIEGAELEAIAGAKEIIKMYTPKLAICIYHKAGDFWKIPSEILKINKNYQFKMRQHDYEVYSETVLYCIPNTKMETIQVTRYNNNLLYRLYNANRKLVYYSKEENKNLIQHGLDKKWFLKQLMGLHKDNVELRSYIDTVLKGKKWLEQQNKNFAEEIENLKNWNTELEESKKWLEQQNKNFAEEIENLKSWNVKLEEGKKWLEQQNKNLTEEIENFK